MNCKDINFYDKNDKNLLEVTVIHSFVGRSSQLNLLVASFCKYMRKYEFVVNRHEKRRAANRNKTTQCLGATMAANYEWRFEGKIRCE